MMAARKYRPQSLYSVVLSLVHVFGLLMITCTTDPAQAQCQPDSCSGNGECLDDSFGLSSSFTCLCNFEYMGMYCSEKIEDNVDKVLDHSDSSNIVLIAALAGGVGGSLLLILLPISICICVRLRRRRAVTGNRTYTRMVIHAEQVHAADRPSSSSGGSSGSSSTNQAGSRTTTYCTGAGVSAPGAVHNGSQGNGTASDEDVRRWSTNNPATAATVRANDASTCAGHVGTLEQPPAYSGFAGAGAGGFSSVSDAGSCAVDVGLLAGAGYSGGFAGQAGGFSGAGVGVATYGGKDGAGAFIA